MKENDGGDESLLAIISIIYKKRVTDGPMDGPIDGRTNSHKAAWTHLKINWSLFVCDFRFIVVSMLPRPSQPFVEEVLLSPPPSP